MCVTRCLVLIKTIAACVRPLRWTCDCSRFNWVEFVDYQKRVNVEYAEAGPQLNVRSRDVLMNEQWSNKRWSTLKLALLGEGGGIVCESVGKVD